MRVLGVDPGLGCTGYGIIEVARQKPAKTRRQNNNDSVLLEAGVIKTSAKEELSNRLRRIYKGLEQVIQIYKPQVLVVEELYSHYRNPRTAIVMAHARGVICLVAANMHIGLIGYSAKKVKMAVTGSGAAKKPQVQKVIKELLRLKKEPSPDDVADALALAITYVNIVGRCL